MRLVGHHLQSSARRACRLPQTGPHRPCGIGAFLCRVFTLPHGTRVAHHLQRATQTIDIQEHEHDSLHETHIGQSASDTKGAPIRRMGLADVDWGTAVAFPRVCGPTQSYFVALCWNRKRRCIGQDGDVLEIRFAAESLDGGFHRAMAFSRAIVGNHFHGARSSSGHCEPIGISSGVLFDEPDDHNQQQERQHPKNRRPCQSHCHGGQKQCHSEF